MQKFLNALFLFNDWQQHFGLGGCRTGMSVPGMLEMKPLQSMPCLVIAEALKIGILIGFMFENARQGCDSSASPGGRAFCTVTE